MRLVVLFGSVATGTARPDSDADIAILGGDFWKALELGSALAAQLGREPHVVDLTSGSDLLRFEVARRGALLFEAEPFAWPEFQARAALMYFDLKPIIERCAEGVRARLHSEGEAPATEALTRKLLACRQRLERIRHACFDRLIVAHALATDAIPLTADGTIREHCPQARWGK